MKTLQDLKTELSASGYEYAIQNNGEGYFMISVTYTGQFGISNGYNIRSFNTCALWTGADPLAFIAFNVKFEN